MWSRREKVEALVLVAPAALLAIMFWRQDSIDPLTAPALLIDRSLQFLSIFAVGLILVIILRAGASARHASTATAAIGVIFGTTVLLSGIVRPPTVWGVMSLAAASIVAGLVTLIRNRASILDLGRNVNGAIAVAVAVGIPLLQFWNGSAFLPARTEAAVNQDVKVSVDDVVDDQFRVRIQFDALNDGDARVQVIITAMTICWWTPVEEVSWDLEELRDRDNCRVERPLSSLAWIPPKSNVDWSRSLTVPAANPRLTVVSRIAYARGDRLRVTQDRTTHRELGECQAVEIIRLEDESKVRALTQPDRFLVFADFDRDGGINYYFDADSVDGCPPADTTRLGEYFGATDLRETGDFWLVAPTSKSIESD